VHVTRVSYRQLSMSTKPGEKTFPRPKWISAKDLPEEELCPDCFKAVGSRNRYKLVCYLGKQKKGVAVGELTKLMGLTQPTITHHLNALRSVDAVSYEGRGRERLYSLNRSAHCFEECRIPF